MEEELLERKTKEELKQIALGLEIPRISTMKKDEIIEAIRERRRQIDEEAKKAHEKRKRESVLRTLLKYAAFWTL